MRITRYTGYSLRVLMYRRWRGLCGDVLAEALEAFFASLDRYTLADLVPQRFHRELIKLLDIPPRWTPAKPLEPGRYNAARKRWRCHR